MRAFAAQILLLMGIPREFVVGFDPIFILFVVVFSTELLLISIIFLIWVFGKRGNVRKYHDGYSGFPSDMVRRADTSDRMHSYDSEGYYGACRKGMFGAVIFSTFVLTAIVFAGIYAYSLWEKGMLF